MYMAPIYNYASFVYRYVYSGTEDHFLRLLHTLLSFIHIIIAICNHSPVLSSPDVSWTFSFSQWTTSTIASPRGTHTENTVLARENTALAVSMINYDRGIRDALFQVDSSILLNLKKSNNVFIYCVITFIDSHLIQISRRYLARFALENNISPLIIVAYRNTTWSSVGRIQAIAYSREVIMNNVLLSGNIFREPNNALKGCLERVVLFYKSHNYNYCNSWAK